MSTLVSSTFKSAVREVIAERHMRKHPFYVAWSQGQLSLDDLRYYAAQYMHHVLAEPTYLSAVHSNTPHVASDGKIDLRARQSILQNLTDEELGSENHPELWSRFARALGLTDADLEATPAKPSTLNLIETIRGICRTQPYYAGLAALHAFESQVPEIASLKIDGLRRFYGIADPAAYEFFSVHRDADVVHSATEWQLIENAADTANKRDSVITATQATCNALWSFLDGARPDPR